MSAVVSSVAAVARLVVVDVLRYLQHVFGAPTGVLTLFWNLCAVPATPRGICRRCYWLRRVNSCTHRSGQRDN